MPTKSEQEVSQKTKSSHAYSTSSPSVPDLFSSEAKKKKSCSLKSAKSSLNDFVIGLGESAISFAIRIAYMIPLILGGF